MKLIRIFMMNKLSIILTLFFLNIVSLKADDIKDFEIEGMSIGSSLLDYYTVDEINQNIDPNIYKDKDGKFKLVGFYGKFGEYDGMQFAFKSSDPKFLIYGINAGIFYSDINECFEQKKSISSEISKLFKEVESYFDNKQIHPADKTNKSYVLTDAFFLKTGSVSVKCFDWSEEITKNYGWGDNLRVGVKLKEYNDWLK